MSQYLGDAAAGAGAGSFFGPVGTVVGAGVGLLGGMLQGQNQSAINQSNLQAAEYVNQGLNLRAYYRNLVGAANSAGINPLALLPGSSPNASINQVGTSGVGGAMGDIGQNLMRAAAAYSPTNEKLEALQIQDLQASVRSKDAIAAGQEIENIRRLKAPGTAHVSVGTPELSTLGRDAFGRIIHVPTEDTREMGGLGKLAQDLTNYMRDRWFSPDLPNRSYERYQTRTGPSWWEGMSP